MTIDEIREWRKRQDWQDIDRGENDRRVIDTLLAEVDRLTVPYVVDIVVSPEDLAPGAVMFVPHDTTRNTAERCAEIAQNEFAKHGTWAWCESCGEAIAAVIRNSFGIEPKDHAAEVEEMAREI